MNTFSLSKIMAKQFCIIYYRKFGFIRERHRKIELFNEDKNEFIYKPFINKGWFSSDIEILHSVIMYPKHYGGWEDHRHLILKYGESITIRSNFRKIYVKYENIERILK